MSFYDYCTDYIEDFEERYNDALDVIGEDKIPLYRADSDLYAELEDALVDWCEDYDENGGSPDDYDIEELLYED